MKKLPLILSFLVLASVARTQIPKEAFDLTNSLSDLWRTSPKEKAVEVSLKLNTMYQPFLIDNLHHNLAQTLQRDRSLMNPQAYLNALWETQDPSIRSLVEPMYVWNKAFDVNTLTDANVLVQRMRSLLKDSTNTKAKTEFYSLMLLKTLKSKELLSAENQKDLLDKVIANLQKYPYLEEQKLSEAANRAWHRYLLAYSMYQKYCTQGEQEAFVKAASHYSPDPLDFTRKEGFFYDAAMLESKTKDVGFQPDYIRFLDKNKRYAEELTVLLEKTYGTPENFQVGNLKQFLTKHPELGLFDELWSKYVSSRMKQVPALKVTYANDVFDFTKPRKHWTFIDVWGTWCSPCVKELPHLNEIAAKYNSLPESKVRIRTFSYMSNQLKEFLSKNNYTFPVAEVGQEVTQPFGINSFPTKLLVSPDNKYLIIPFNVNWEEYMRNYILFE